MIILTSSHCCHNILKSVHTVALRHTNNLTNFLYDELNHATLQKTMHPPEVLFSGAVMHCSTCTYISNEPTYYTFHSTGETSLTSHRITYNSKNFIYMIKCKRCAVTNNIWEKLKNYLKIASTNTAVQLTNPANISKRTSVSEHFLADHHTINDISLIPLELVHCNRDSVHKAREAYLITKGNTPQPLGLNKRDEI